MLPPVGAAQAVPGLAPRWCRGRRRPTHGPPRIAVNGCPASLRVPRGRPGSPHAAAATGSGFREFRRGGGGAREAGCTSRSGGAARTPPHALPVRADGNSGHHGLVSGLEDLLGAFDAVLESEFKKWVISGNSDYCAPAGLCVSRDLPCDRAGKCLVADEHVVHAP